MGSSQVRQQLKEKLQKEAAQYNPGKELRLVMLLVWVDKGKEQLEMKKS